MQIVRLLLLFSVFVWSGIIDIYDSGGPLMPEQAAYDVTYYDLNLVVSPEDSSISGFVKIDARIVQPIDYFVVDLDTLLKIEKVVEWQSGQELTRTYQREIGKIWVELKTTRQPGEAVSIQIFYDGRPLIAERPPWSGGFTWARTADNQPWISTSCQGEGPDIWWPVKDHVSDEPDSMGIHITVPDHLICASNGRLRSVEKHADHSSTFHWFVSTPINNYDVALNIAPYRVIEKKYTNPYGESFPFMFWVLPQDYEKGLAIMPEFMEHMYFFEELLGPYPFRADKYGVAQTPHLGMEHQTIIAYGAKFDNSSMTSKDWGFDALHHHELAHEWWGNMLTNTDWKDMWLHEGFGTYMQALYMEKLQGMEGYHRYINARHFKNEYAIAPQKTQTANEMFEGPPIYSKGAAVLHSLRYLIGYDNLKKALRHMLYPDPRLEKITDGSQARFVTTNDFINSAEKVSGMDLDWFFNVYVHQPSLPMLVSRLEDDVLYLSWKTPQNMPFPMPIDIKVGEKIKRYEINESGIKVNIDRDKTFKIDPQKWVLFELAGLKEAQTYLGNQQYDQARKIYDGLLVITPNDIVIGQMLKHVQYAMLNREKIDGNFYDSYLVSYKTATGRDYSFVKENKNFYMISKRGKYKIYPVADNIFTFADFNGRLTFEIDQAKGKKQFKFNIGNMIIHGEEVSKS